MKHVKILIISTVIVTLVLAGIKVVNRVRDYQDYLKYSQDENTNNITVDYTNGYDWDK